MKRFVPSPAMVVALLALVVATAGSAAALSNGAAPFVRVYQNAVVHRGGVTVAAADCPANYHVVRGGYSTQQGREVIPIAAYYTKDLKGYQVGVLVPPGIAGAAVSVVRVSADCEQ